MDTSDTQAVIINALADWGTAVLAIITATLAIGLAYLVFRFGWKKTKSALNSGEPTVFRDSMERNAFNRGKALNKRDGVSLFD